MVPVLIYKALLATFGMDSARPFQVIEVLSFLLSDALLFIWIRRRVGAWLALAAVVPILFLGSAYEDLLWQFQVGYFGSMACGLGMLLALDRDDRVGDRWACALLAASMTFSSVGLAFLAPAARPCRLGRTAASSGIRGRDPGRPLRALVAWLGAHRAEHAREQEPRDERELHARRALCEPRLAARARHLAGRRVADPGRLGAPAAVRRRRLRGVESGAHPPDRAIAGCGRNARACVLVPGGSER